MIGADAASATPYKLAAIAGGDNDRFLENSVPAQLGCSVQRLLVRKSDALAQLDRRGAMVAADQGDVDPPANAALAARLLRIGLAAISRSDEIP